MPKATTEIRSLARSHTEAAIKVLAGVMNQIAGGVRGLEAEGFLYTIRLPGDPETPIRVDWGDLEGARRLALILWHADPARAQSKGR